MSAQVGSCQGFLCPQPLTFKLCWSKGMPRPVSDGAKRGGGSGQGEGVSSLASRDHPELPRGSSLSASLHPEIPMPMAQKS